jgi:hypothetical protein
MSEEARRAFAAAEDALVAGETLETVLGKHLIVPLTETPGSYHCHGCGGLFFDSSCAFLYDVVDGASGGYKVNCWCEPCCGGDHTPRLVYSVQCPTLVSVAGVFLYDGAHEPGMRHWTEESVEAMAPTLFRLLSPDFKSTPQLTRVYPRDVRRGALDNIVCMTEYAASSPDSDPGMIERLESSIRYYDVSKTQLLQIHDYFESAKIPFGERLAFISILPEELLPPCWKVVFDKLFPIREAPLFDELPVVS